MVGKVLFFIRYWVLGARFSETLNQCKVDFLLFVNVKGPVMVLVIE